MADSEDFKKAAPKGNAPDVNDPLQNQLLKHVKSATCTPTVSENFYTVTVCVDPVILLSPYQENSNSLAKVIRLILTDAGASNIQISSITNADPDNTDPNRTNEFSISARGEMSKIQEALKTMVEASQKMALGASQSAAG